MKILYTSQELYPESPGGAGNSAYFAAKGLAEREDVEEVRVLTATENESRIEEEGDLTVKRFEDLMVEYRTVKKTGFSDIFRKIRNFRKSGEWRKKIIEEVEEFEPDVIHAQHLQTASPALRVGDSKDIPVILSLRDHWAVCFHSSMLDRKGNRVPEWGWKETLARERWKFPYAMYKLKRRRKMLRKASGLHYISRHIREVTEKHTKVPANTKVVHNPVDLEGEWDDKDREDGMVLFAGRLARVKGVPELLDGFEKLVERGVDSRLVIAGEGPGREEYEKIVEEKGIEDAVEFAGWVDDMPSYYRRAQVTVIPSVWYEPMGRVGLEAMSHGSVPLVSKYGGLPETVPDEELVIDPEDSEQLADDIQDLINSSKKRESYRPGFEDFLQQFSSESVGEGLMKLYGNFAQ